MDHLGVGFSSYLIKALMDIRLQTNAIYVRFLLMLVTVYHGISVHLSISRLSTPSLYARVVSPDVFNCPWRLLRRLDLTRNAGFRLPFWCSLHGLIDMAILFDTPRSACRMDTGLVYRASIAWRFDRRNSTTRATFFLCVSRAALLFAFSLCDKTSRGVRRRCDSSNRWSDLCVYEASDGKSQRAPA